MRRLLLAWVATLVVQAQPLPRVQTFALPNGLRVVHLEDHEHPLVRVQLRFLLRPSDTPPGLQGLAALTLELLHHSPAGDLKPEAFDRSLATSGITLLQVTTPEYLEWQLTTRSRDQDRALGLLADRVLRTVFDPALLETQRLDCWRETQGPDLPPRQRLRSTLRLAARERPTELSLGRISFDDLLAFRARVLRPDRALLVLHGDLGLEQAKRLLLLNLGSWSSSPSALEIAPQAVPEKEPLRLAVLAARGVGLRIQVWAPRPAEVSPESAALLGLLLQGDPTHRGLQFSAEDSGLEWTLDTEDQGAATQAWTLVQVELEQLRQRRFTEAELEHARRALLARRSLTALHPEEQMATALADASGQGLHSERLRTLSPAKLQADLARWLQPANLRTGALGTPEALEALEALR